MFSRRVQDMKPSGVRKFFSLASEMDRCLDLSIGQPDFGVPDKLKALANEAITCNRNSYSPSIGLESARNAIKEKYSIKNDSNYDVIITSGVSGGLFLAYATLLDQGDEILIPDPYFIGYKEIAVMLGAKPVFFDTYPDFVPTPERIEPLITKNTKAIIIGNPSNPTGYVMSKEELHALSDFALTKGLYLIYDEIYEAFCYDGDHFRPVLNEKVIILNGLSKSHAMTGWRLGWMIASTALIEQFQKVQQYSFICAPSPFQYVIGDALKYEDKNIFLNYKSKRDRVVADLSKKFELTRPGGAFYAFPKILNGTASEFVKKCISNSLLVIPGSVFSLTDSNIRISFAVKDEILDEALEILLRI